jgi:DNA topoisomerase-3
LETTLTYGLSQTPTIAFCVNRHDEIMDFKPQPYWLLDGDIELPKGFRLNLQWTRDRQFDKNTARQFLKKIKVDFAFRAGNKSYNSFIIFI